MRWLVERNTSTVRKPVTATIAQWTTTKRFSATTSACSSAPGSETASRNSTAWTRWTTTMIGPMTRSRRRLRSATSRANASRSSGVSSATIAAPGGAAFCLAPRSTAMPTVSRCRRRREPRDRLVADLAPQNLPRRRARQWLRRPQDVAWDLVAREMLGEERAELVEIERVAGVDRRADLLAHAVVGHRVDRRFADLGMHQQRGLDVAAADVLATADDQVLDPVDDVEEALVVEVRAVAGAKPVAGERRCGGLGLVPVAAKHRGAAHP